MHMRAAFVAIALVQFGALTAAGPALPTVRVVSDQATVFERTDLKSAVMAEAPSGMVFDVLDKEGNWYWVLMPRDTNGTRRPGWIEARHVEIAAAAAPGSAPRSLTGQADDVRTTLEGPRTDTREADARAQARLQKALRDLEKARREYEAVTKKPDEPR